MRFYRVFFVLILFGATGLVADTVHIRVPFSERAMQWLLDHEIAPNIDAPTNTLTFESDRTMAARLSGAGFPNLIYKIDLQDRVINGYHDYNTMLAQLQAIVAAHPDIATLVDLGPSQCNLYRMNGDSDYNAFQHRVWCVKISDNPGQEEDEPNVYYMGQIHSREIMSMEVTLAVLNRFVSGYGSDPAVTARVDNHQIWFVPMINPDGAKIVFDLTNQNFRKTLRDNNGNGLPEANNADGVDANRNFGYVWGNNGASSTPSSEIYHGPFPWSEPEITYLRDLIRGRKFIGGITYHSSGQWVLYPLGHINGANALDHQIMGDLAEEMANTIPTVDYYGNYSSSHYTAAQAVDFGYTCQGTMGDWGYSEERIFAFTVELGSQHFHSSTTMLGICNDNLEAADIFIDRTTKYIVTGQTTSESGNPLPAVVRVHEIDDQTGMTPVEPYRSHGMFGRYFRPLQAGAYTFTFSAEGFLPLTMTNVPSTAAPTTLNVALYAEYVPEPMISVADSVVTLSWPETDLFDFEVESSTLTDSGFSEDLSGVFTDSHTWQCTSGESSRFYRVRRVLRRNVVDYSGLPISSKTAQGIPSGSAK